MWEPRPLTPLWAFTACYRDSFTLLFFFTLLLVFVITPFPQFLIRSELKLVPLSHFLPVIYLLTMHINRALNFLNYTLDHRSMNTVSGTYTCSLHFKNYDMSQSEIRFHHKRQNYIQESTKALFLMNN
jgi:hypothetical protein